MKKYIQPFFIVLMMGFVLLGFYLKRSGILLSDIDNAIQIGKVENCIPADDVCVVELDGKTIGFHLPDDAAYLQDFPVEVHLIGFDDLKIKSVQVKFNMQGMDMGINQIRLQRKNIKFWSGTGKLAVCSTGRMDWLAKVIIQSNKNIYQADFVFNVGKNRE